MTVENEKSSFGYFQEEGREFVVTEVNTPRAWMNYSWNSRFISAISQHGGGDGAYKERAIQAVDPRGRVLLVRDGHRYFYLRDVDSGDVWSPGWHPVQSDVEDFSCTHGAGYSKLRSRRKGIEAELRWFVPRNSPCEVWTIRLRNRRDETARVQCFSFADLLLGGFQQYCDYYSSLSGEYEASTGTVFGINLSPDCPHDGYKAFLGSDRVPDGFDTSRRRFLGNFGHVNAPEAVVEGGCRNSLAANEKLVAATEHRFELAPGSEVLFHVFIGACTSMAEAETHLAPLRRTERIEEEFEALRTRKEETRERLVISSPIPKVNYFVNTWLKQQVQIYADVGSDNGRGFRDAMQLLWATASFDLQYTKRMLDECLRHQYADGHTLRGWLPVDDHHYSDGPVWIAPVVDAYVKESGDSAILDHVVPYFDQGEATVWEHTLQGLRHSSDDLGPRGLVRCHFGDWNDSLTGVDRAGQGESVWTSIAIVYSLKVAARLARRIRGDASLAEELMQRAAKLTSAIWRHGWDGQWFLRAINDEGERIGGADNREGRIWLLPQVWAVLAGIVEGDQAAQLFGHIDTHLATPYGFKTFDPPFTSVHPGVGRVSTIAPGMWENGTPYCHASGFKVLADCAAGRGAEALDTWLRVMPDNSENPSTHSGCEPYAFTNQYIGPDNRRAGETQFAWMTGAGGWFFRAMTEGIFGVRADFDGLLVDPCLPPSWKDCELTREFRGARYHIRFRNPNGLSNGDVKLTVDGHELEGNLLPAYGDGQLHEVEAMLS